LSKGKTKWFAVVENARGSQKDTQPSTRRTLHGVFYNCQRCSQESYRAHKAGKLLLEERLAAQQEAQFPRLHEIFAKVQAGTDTAACDVGEPQKAANMCCKPARIDGACSKEWLDAFC